MDLGLFSSPCLYRFSNECDDHAITIVKPVPTIFQYLHLYLCQRIFRRRRKCRHLEAEVDVGDDSFSFVHSCSSPLPNTANRNAPMKDSTDAVMKTFLHPFFFFFFKSFFFFRFSASLALFVLVILFLFFPKVSVCKMSP